MSSLPPDQQSLAGGIFNTVTKICGAVGLGISASLYNAESTGHAALQTTVRPYRMVFWFCLASAALGLCCVPFLTIGTQGHSEKRDLVTNLSASEVVEDEKMAVSGLDKELGIEMTDFNSREEVAEQKIG
jgi:hypothetical protein